MDLEDRSSTNYVPFKILDTHFLAGLLVVVKPLPFCQLNPIKFGMRLDPIHKPLSLNSVSGSESVC